MLAIAPESAIINVDNVQTAFMFPCTPCNPGLAGLSSGDITGVDAGGNPFEVAWPVNGSVANLSGSMSVYAICGPNSPVVTGGTFGGSITVTGAEFIDNGVHSNASVTAVFSGNWIGTAMAPVVTSLTVSSGAASLALAPTVGAGAVTITPTPPPAGCIGSQGYTLSGTMLTAA